LDVLLLGLFGVYSGYNTSVGYRTEYYRSESF